MAAQELAQGNPIYNVNFSNGDINMPGNPYCPSFILFLLPFSFLPYKICLFLWYLFNVALLNVLFRKLSQNYCFSTVNIGLILFSILLFARSMMSLFQNGQVNILMVFLMIYGVILIFEDREILGSGLLAGGILLKIMPIVFIPYILYRGRMKAVVFVLLWMVVIVLIPCVYIGWQQNIGYYLEWYHIINPFDHIFVTSNQIAGRDHFGIDEFCMIVFVKWILRLILIGIIAFVCKSSFNKKYIASQQFLWEISLISLSASLLFPVQLLYSFVSAIPMCFYISQYYNSRAFYKKMKYTFGIVLFLILTLFCSDLFIGREWMHLSLHYKCITFGFFVLIGIHLNLKPKMTVGNISP
jgi:hypothetical protein